MEISALRHVIRALVVTTMVVTYVLVRATVIPSALFCFALSLARRHAVRVGSSLFQPAVIS